MGPSERENSRSTNQGSVCASSFSAPPSSASPSSVMNSFQRFGSARNAGTLNGDSASARSGVAPASGAVSSSPCSSMRKPATAGPTRNTKERPANGASRSRAHGSRSSTRFAADSAKVIGLPLRGGLLAIVGHAHGYCVGLSRSRGAAPSGLGSLRSPAALTRRPPCRNGACAWLLCRPLALARRRPLRASARFARPPRSRVGLLAGTGHAHGYCVGLSRSRGAAPFGPRLASLARRAHAPAPCRNGACAWLLCRPLALARRRPLRASARFARPPRSRVLLDPGQKPAAGAVDRLHEVPQLLERQRRRRAVLPQRAVEAHAGDVAIALLHDFDQLGVECDDVGRDVSSARGEVARNFRLHLRRGHVVEQRHVGAIVGGLQPAKLLLRLRQERRWVEAGRITPAGGRAPRAPRGDR